jgi:hypothetical protein
MALLLCGADDFRALRPKEGTTVSEKSNTRETVESEEPQDRQPDRDEMAEFLRLLLEIEEQTPEEAGYGHGV